jgi:hypothetical protein
MISAMPVRGEPGHYTVNFPLRPGATKFAFNYDLPYDGHLSFRTRNMYPLQQLAIMIPPTMTFASKSPAFQILPVSNSGYKVEAAEQLKAGAGPEFEISGVGELASLQAQVHAPPKPSVDAYTTSPVSTPGGFEEQSQGLNALKSEPVLKSSMQSPQSRWWIFISRAALMLGIGGGVVLSRKNTPSNTIANAVYANEQSGQRSASLVEALKDGLFLLESDRLQGTIHKRQYASVKLALEGTIEWAVTRTGAYRKTNRCDHL